MPYIFRRRPPQEAQGDASPAPPDLADPGSHRPDRLVEVATTAMLVLSPLMLGSVHLPAVLVLLGLSLTGYAALLARHLRHHRGGLKLFPLGVAMLCATLLTLLQAVPLPPFLVRVLNPEAASLYGHMLSGTGLWGEGQFRPLSLSAPSTWFELLKYFGYTLAFIVVVNYYNDRHRARRLLKAVAWTGFLVAIIGFFSKLLSLRAILGFYPVGSDNFFFSTFVNPNHLAGFLLLTSPTAVGLALSARERQDRALYLFLGAVSGAALLMTLSRGGIVAFGAACLFLFFLVATRRSRRIRRLALVQGAVALVLLGAGYLAYDTILREMKSLGNLGALREETKIAAWGGTLEMIGDHPVLGIGRGAYATVYPRYRSVPHEATFTHAENGPLQLMAEWGPVFGSLFLLTFLACLGLALTRVRESLSMGGCLAAVFGSAAHNLVDFNLEVAGVAVTFVVLLGVLAASPFSHAGGPRPVELRFRLPRKAAVAAVPLIILVSTWAAFAAGTRSLSVETERLLSATGGPCEPCEECELGRAACLLLRDHPSDYLASLVLGKAYLESRPPNLTRAVRHLSRAMERNPRDASAHRLAGRALFFAGHRDQAMSEYRLAAENQRGILTATVVEVLRLTGDPEMAIAATPQDPDSLLSTARILHNLGKDESAMRACRLTLDLNGTRLDALELLGRLALDAERLEEAAAAARQAIEIDPLFDRAYLLQGEVLLRQKDLVRAEAAWLSGFEQVPDSTALAYRLGEYYLGADRLKEAEGVADRLQSFAPTDDRSQAQLQALFGRIQEKKGRLFEARRSFQLAAQLAPDMPSYRLRLAQVEERMGHWDEAIRIYEDLKAARHSPREMDERIEAAKKASEKEGNQARWEDLVEKGKAGGEPEPPPPDLDELGDVDEEVDVP
ncbi:MAG: tetratricopeptide repeat protein [Myxococcales bacterium]|nr:tetratricopeptide repeat protein [Myxococcales bacterium]